VGRTHRGLTQKDETTRRERTRQSKGGTMGEKVGTRETGGSKLISFQGQNFIPGLSSKTARISLHLMCEIT
jgi:hypothetical protein